MDSIRCDEKDFLIWKWRPDSGRDVGGSKKENSIRYGSSLRVRPGQAAVFLYQNKGEYDIIKGPYDDIVRTENMPVLASIVGLAYKGGTPFQAEVYYINLARGMEIPFTIPYFRVIPSEPEYKAYDIEVAVKGAMAFQIPTDPVMTKYFLEAWGSSDTSMREFSEKVKALLTQEVKQIVTNVPKDTGIFIMHFNQLIGEIGHYILSRVQERIMQRFGVFASDILIEDIRYDEDSESFQRLKRLTEDQAQTYNLENEKTTLLSFEIQRETMRTDADIRNQTAKEMAQMQMEHMRDMTERMREEGQFAQHMQTEQAAKQAGLGSESAYINAHSINKQAEVLRAGMENIGQMGSMNFGGGDGHMNPAGMMTGMMMGAAMGGQVGNMMNQMGQTMQQNMASAGQPQQTPPPIPTPQQAVWYLAINGSQYGPCDVSALSQMLAAGQINGVTLAWSAGMASWQPMKEIPALSGLFAPPAGAVPPPIPNIPPIPGK
jgi:membrane protease subunit (stomatin/prohibitin family)